VSAGAIDLHEIVRPEILDASRTWGDYLRADVLCLFQNIPEAKVNRPAAAVALDLREQHPRARDLLDRLCYDDDSGRAARSPHAVPQIEYNAGSPSCGSSRKNR
jgi:hypothetical protein